MSDTNPTQDQQIITCTRAWVEQVIVGLNFCPFAAPVVKQGTIRYSVIHEQDVAAALEAVINECRVLDADDEIETALLIFPESFKLFEQYLGFYELADDLLIEQGYEGTYQLASFHPQYCFADSDENDAANYTNRSPYPMLHLIREASIEKALAHYPDPEGVPERNIERCRNEGLDKMKQRLAACINDKQRDD